MIYKTSFSTLALLAAALLSLSALHAAPPEPTQEPTLRAVDLKIGEAAEVKLADGSVAQVKLLDLQEKTDTMAHAVRQARVKVAVNGAEVWLTSANYHLPQSVGGVQIDCPITRGYNANSGEDSWGLVADARLRLWPAGAPWIEPGTFVYPLKQRWFATMTQFSNEPTYADGGDKPDRKKIYYHNDLDFGGCEGLVEVVAATDGLVVSARNQTLDGYSLTPVRPRYDVVYVLDARGWYYRYSHFHSIDEAVQPGTRVKMGQRMGLLGKEGASGGWSHLHFGIKSRQPSGKWGTQEAYAFAWQSYVREHKPAVIAVARPHHLIHVGETITLDASKSWAASGKIARYEWTLSDGTQKSGASFERTYTKAGSTSEIVKVTDDAGNTSYDFAIVQVIGDDQVNIPPAIHPSFSPTMNLKPGQEITFKVRTYRDAGGETWDFGDGTPPVAVTSDGNAKALAKDGYAVTTHRFAKAGDYIVKVEHVNARGEKALAHLWVRVE
ncbi:PKD domain-containing protein [Prosthecobacter vanneervenii]|uniref:Murein DD-endopeptidase MepM/ murein hydrolase activator NlpD n=1 Tax=Prosthecobacter vanneervenii TaxID=48466 RepID=A0A7W7YGQ2_9BACT|nr:PKD domain-containing protein [Prosthecobacter vanneervenii]MBB5035550.1 murein DD-endopeptidase MepM/ murein hydrolase activator NlpD [Prosthecobacter vanneervenii]